MKRLAPLLIASALLILSCSQSGKAKPRLGLAMRSFDEPVSVTVRQTIETRALDKAELSVVDGHNQQSAQDLGMEALFQGKIGALAMDPVDLNALGPTIGKAKDSRIPIVFFDREPSDQELQSWDRLFFVGTRGTEAGEAVGQMVAAYWKATPFADANKDGKIQYILLASAPADPGTALFEASFAKALGAAGFDAKRLSSRGAGSPPVVSAPVERAADLIAKLGDGIELAICADSASTMETLAAFQAAGFPKGKRRIPIVGVSEGELPLLMSEALDSGSLFGAAVSDSVGLGDAVFDLAYALALGKNPAKAGWRVTDAKFVWIPYRKVLGKAPPK